MIKQIHKLLLFITATFFAANVHAHDVEIDGIYYNLNTTDKTASVTYEGATYFFSLSEYSGDVVIPATTIYNGTIYLVTSIGEHAFWDCKELTSISIPSSVTIIGESAFWGCSGLTSISIPSSVTTIGESAFGFCTGLTSINVSSDNPVYSSANGILYNKDKTNLLTYPAGNTGTFIIPSFVTTIGNCAFNGCIGLTSFTIPSSVTSIGYGAFGGCRGLTSINIPSSVTTIVEKMFSGCTGLTTITIPCSVTSIGNEAFSGCTGLTTITIPNSVTNIGDKAFYNCTGLTSIAISGTIRNIGQSAFNCNSRSIITVKPIDSVTKFFWYDLSKNCNCQISIEISEQLRTIGDETFSGSKNINSVTISSSTTEFGLSVFKNCTNIKSVNISDYATKLGGFMFKGCTGLTSIKIPASLTQIGMCAFEGCTGLTSIDLSSATCIGSGMFGKCTGLTAINIPNSVTTIEDFAFSGCTGLTSIKIPASLTQIGMCAFEGCTGLTSIDLSSATCIGYGMFGKCTGLTSVDIPASVTQIGNKAFCGCTSLKEINVDETNTFYSSVDGVLYTKDKTKLVLYPAGGKNNFAIPNFVTAIGDYAFNECTGLTSINIPNSVTAIGYDAFYRCTGLTSINIPNSVTNIGQEAFSGSGLTSINLPNSVTNIGRSVFSACNNLISLYLHNKQTKILADFNSVFYGINNNCILYVPAGLKESYVSANNRNKTFASIEPLYLLLESLDVAETKSPTCLTLKGSYTEDFAHVVESGFEGYSTGDSILVTSLEPDTENSFAYYAIADDGYREDKIITVTTPALELTTLQPRCVSSSCAIVAATTNISEEETNVGFQWKKYDAPASLKPNEGYSAIYDGQLEGYIRNLQPTSYYNVRAFYKSAAGNYYYGDWVTFDPSDFSYFEPTVHTYAAEAVTANSARVKGYVLAGTDEIEEQGFEYWPTGTDESQTKSVRATKAETETDGIQTVFATGQVMTAELRDLRSATTYCLRAFVKTAAGKTYGEEQTFTTPGLPTDITETATSTTTPTVEGYYDLNGRKFNAPQRGINIIRYSNGTTRKIVVR